MFPVRLKELRIARRFTQDALGKKLSVSQKTVASWENGRTVPDTDKLTEIADFFNVSLDYLLTEKLDTTIEDVYFGMAKTLRDNGITQRDLEILLETREHFLKLNGNDKS